jgi:hypothetical protein
MIDDKSIHGEVLEFTAVTIPFKWHQMIDIDEQTAKSMDEFVEMFTDPADRKQCLEKADIFRKEREQIWWKWPMIRLAAQSAQREIDELK